MKHLLVLLGAAAGGTLGWFAFFWIVRRGFYGIILPGALVGLGAGFFANRSVAVAILCGLFALALGVFAEWRYAPFEKDDSLGFFLTHVHHLKQIKLLMIVGGGLIGFWIPFSRIPPAEPSIPVHAPPPA